MDFASGLVLAAIVAAVIAVERLGGADELARRLYQVALGVGVAATMITGSMAFIHPGDDGTGVRIGARTTLDIPPFEQNYADSEVTGAGVNFLAGVIAVGIGISTLSRWRTVALGVLVGGLLLVLVSGGASALSQHERAFYSQASDEYLLFRFLAAAGGTALLLWYGFSHWESPARTAPAEHDEDQLPDDV
jgi:hypothetical protein